MIDYADYKFYEMTYRGSISSSLFNSLIPKASREIDKAVNRELKEEDITNKVRFVACELVDFFNSNELKVSTKKQKLNSVSIDGVSKNFVNTTKSVDDMEIERAKILSGLPHELTRFL